MNTVQKSRDFWEQVRDQVAANPAHEGISIPRGNVPHPRDAGARPSTNWPVGQIADYAIDGAPGKPPLVIREYPDRWEVFVETVHMTSHAMATIDNDPQKAMFTGAAMLGGAIGASLSNKRSGMIVGIGLGILAAAAIMMAIDNADAAQKKPPRRRRQT